MIKTRILLAEDDENLGSLLKEYLNIKGYETELYPDGNKAFKGFIKEHFDLCILDIMMPEKDGFTVAKEIRLINSDIPIIFLTAKSLKEDVLEGFTIGADDYITKPFSIEELLYRIEAILRRTKPGQDGGSLDVFQLGNYNFDAKKQLLTYGKKVQKLTTKESELLKLLCNNKNKVLERNFALRTIWIDDNYFNARSMDVYITKLRKYLKEEPSIEIINVHGKGYKLIC
ncbi:MAG: response regulator transcription factor [Bacteroidales bacterium]|nr:response regulator transcription factor [Bacteroidales bacterium]